jgi:riboflavin kinase/FMN adenylyltransferase
MRVVSTFDELAGIAERICLAVGVFDGVHLGHQRVIGQARDDARSLAGAAVALTFEPHPLRVLRPGKAPPLLTSTKHKLRLIEQAGASVCLVLKFDEALSLLAPEKFIELVAHRTRSLVEICVGSRFRFGHDRAGDVRLIEKLAATHGFAVKEVPDARLGDEVISSTAIRQHVQHGRLDRAAEMLGRQFSILGAVARGDSRGRQLGFPTANVDPHNEVLPPDGVYAVRAIVAGQTHGGVANLGLRPTFPANQPSLEVHIFDFDRELYGDDIEVVFVKKLRDEKRFDSAEALKRQMTADAEAARTLLLPAG